MHNSTYSIMPFLIAQNKRMEGSQPTIAIFEWYDCEGYCFLSFSVVYEFFKMNIL